jgi:putative SOS response-associated peptidase YedK
MCGRVVVALQPEEIIEASKSKSFVNKTNYRKSYNVAPYTYLPASYKLKKNDEIYLEDMKWGTKNSQNVSLINARSENLLLYYKNWKRCVIIINGYYEWKKIFSNLDVQINTQPFYIKSKLKNYLLVAGIYKENKEVNICLL